MTWGPGSAPLLTVVVPMYDEEAVLPIFFETIRSCGWSGCCATAVTRRLCPRASSAPAATT